VKKSFLLVIILEILLIVLLVWLLYLWIQTQKASDGSFFESIKSYWGEIHQNKNTQNKTSVKEKHGRAEKESRQFDPDRDSFVKDEQYNEEVEEIAKTITPGEENDFITMANDFHRAGNYRKSMQYYDAAIKVNPQNAMAYCNRSALKNTILDYEGAVEDASAAIKINPTPYAYHNRIAAYEKLGNLPGALNDIEVYKGNDWPHQGYAYYQEGRCYMQSGNYFQDEDFGSLYVRNMYYEMAVKAFDEAENTLSHEYKKYLYESRGDCYLALANIEKAKIDYAKAESLGSEYAGSQLKKLQKN